MTGRPYVLDLAGVEVWVPSDGRRLRLLHGIDWRVRRGERWALLGHNGAGKTTLLSLAGAVRHPSAGTVEILGRRLGRVDVRELRAEVGNVDGAQRVPGELSLTDYVLTGATGTVAFLPGLVGPDDRKRAAEVVELLGLAHLAGRRIGVCSQGERGRARIARALMPDPRLLLLDEPAAALDLPAREELLEALDTLTREAPDLALVLVTHHLEELPSAVTHALVLGHGTTVAAGPASEVVTSAVLSRAYGLPLRVRREHGRWSATLARR